MLWIEENQLGRRNLTDDQRAVVAGRLANRRAEASRKAAAAMARDAKANGTSVVAKNTTTEKRDPAQLRNDVAQEAKVKPKKVRDAQKLGKAAKKSEKAKQLETEVLNGNMPLAKALTELKSSAAEDPKLNDFITRNKNPHAEYLQRLRELDTPRFFDTVKALPPTDNVREQILKASDAALQALLRRIAALASSGHRESDRTDMRLPPCTSSGIVGNGCGTGGPLVSFSSLHDWQQWRPRQGNLCLTLYSRK